MLRDARWGRIVGGVALLLCVLPAVVSCGGGGGGSDALGAGRGLALLSCSVDGVDNVPLNRRIVFRFSEPINAGSVHAGSLQIREGPAFGLTVAGRFVVEGSEVRFEPLLPGRRLDPGESNACDVGESGLKPGTAYRITVVGHPEELVVRNRHGQSLDASATLQFWTRSEDDAGLLEDAHPGSAPSVLSSTPADGTSDVSLSTALRVGGGPHVRFDGLPDRVQVSFSENLHPCSLDHDSVWMEAYEIGDPEQGFVPGQDAAPSDPYSWGSDTATTLSPPLRVPCRIELDQTFDSTVLTLRPLCGRFPENALVVVEMSPSISDFGGQPLSTPPIAFTTQNRPTSHGAVRFEFDESTPIDPVGKTAHVHLPYAPSRAQGLLNFAGDGDNGIFDDQPAFPVSVDEGPCEAAVNDGHLDDFDPSENVTLDTGASLNPCRNDVDGSYAVVFEFSSFTIRSGVTVTLTGSNPAIILVTGPVLISEGGVLDASGLKGENGVSTSSAYGLPWPKAAKGGDGVAGGGRGGDSQAIAEVHPNPNGAYGADGWSGYGSSSYESDPEGGVGGGQGGSAAGFIGPFPTFGSSGAGGGGGGHALPGGDGGTNLGTSNGWLEPTPRGEGGAPYPDGQKALELWTPSAGSGGGAGGYCDCVAGPTGHRPGCTGSGGAGGGGGGFLDITSSTGITVHGTIAANGGRGGNGGISFYIDIGDCGGGGGGAGGSIRLLTSGDLDVTGGTITTSGGAGGSGYVSVLRGAAAPNHGGRGATGRVVLEDADGIIQGQSSATIVPSEGEEGFHRGILQEARFRSGGTTTRVATAPVFLGPLSSPSPRVPLASDFDVGVPADTSRGLGATAIVVEVQGFPARVDGTMDEEAGTGWWTVGHFRDTGSVQRPEWLPGVAPVDVPLVEGNRGTGIENVDGMGYVQVRFTFHVADGSRIGAAGPYVDRFDLRFDHEDL